MKRKALGVVVAVLVLVLAVWQLRRRRDPLPRAAESFLRAVAAGDASAAYRSMPDSSRRARSELEFRAFLQSRGLDDFRSAVWTHASVQGDRAELGGRLTTGAGHELPVTLKLERRNKRWRVASVQAAEGTDGVALSVPGEAALRRITDEAVRLLTVAVNEDDFGVLYAGVSVLWQEQTTEQALRERFKDYVEREIDLSFARREAPIFEPKPSLDGNGILRVQGYYPTPPPLGFDMAFVFERGEWRLLNLRVEL